MNIAENPYIHGETISKRMQFIQEGMDKPQPSGHWIQRGAMWVDGPIPVCPNGDLRVSIGWATDFERDADGWLSFNITVGLEHIKDLDEYTLSGYSNEVEGDRFKGDDNVIIHKVTKARIRAIYLMPIPVGAVVL